MNIMFYIKNLQSRQSTHKVGTLPT